MSGSASRSADGGLTSMKPTFDHENAIGNEALPNGATRHSNPLQGDADNRSVMWAVPALWAGSRSESPGRHKEPANGVTSTEPAQQVKGHGATVAGDVTQRRTPSAEVMRNVIDVGFVDEGSSANDACPFGDDVTGTVDKAAIAAQFEVVRKAREQIQAVHQARDKRRDTKPSAETVEQYEKKLVLLDKKAWREHAESASPLCAAIASLSGKRQSFYAYRAAAAWREIKAVRRLLTQQDALQRRGNYGADWLGCIDDLRTHCEQLREIQALTLKAARTMATRTPQPASSKKNVLRNAQLGWRERFLEASAKSKRYAAACVLLANCGMRPKEIEDGLTVRRGRRVVGVKINGAKVRDIAGQPWRVLFVPVEKFPAWFLDELGNGDAKVYAAPAAAMRSYLRRLSPKVFPPRSGAKQQLLSAYVLRHAVATDLRQQGWSDEELAAVLGERVAETARHYGLYRRGARGGRQPEAAIVRDQVKTAIPVRARDKHWLNEVRPTQKRSQAKRKAGGV
jgi:hypothetical protein